MIGPLPLVAWWVCLDDTNCVVFATTRDKAKYRVVLSWKEAGYGRRSDWPTHLSGNRAPDYDRYKYNCNPGTPYIPAYLDSYPDEAFK